MQTFAQKHNQPQRRVSSNLGRSNKPTPGLHPSASRIRHLQRTIGNQATQRLLQQADPNGLEAHSSSTQQVTRSEAPTKIQAKLTVNTPGDIYEQEADRIAAQVMATPAHHAVSGAPPRIQRFSGQSNGQTDAAAPASVAQALASPGRPLEPALRQDMEQRFGHNFSRVRVHSDPTAEQSAQDMNAHAYTVGDDMVFGAGRFAPGTHQGQRLIAHELTHVVQGAGHAGAPVVRRQGPRPDVFPTNFKIISPTWRIFGRDIVIIETDTGIRQPFYKNIGEGDKGAGRAPPPRAWVPFTEVLPHPHAPTDPWFNKTDYYYALDKTDPLRGYGNALNKYIGGQLDTQNIPPAKETPWQQVKQEMDDVLRRQPSLQPATPPAVTASGEIGGGGGRPGAPATPPAVTTSGEIGGGGGRPGLKVRLGRLGAGTLRIGGGILKGWLVTAVVLLPLSYLTAREQREKLEAELRRVEEDELPIKLEEALLSVEGALPRSNLFVHIKIKLEYRKEDWGSIAPDIRYFIERASLVSVDAVVGQPGNTPQPECEDREVCYLDVYQPVPLAMADMPADFQPVLNHVASLLLDVSAATSVAGGGFDDVNKNLHIALKMLGKTWDEDWTTTALMPAAERFATVRVALEETLRAATKVVGTTPSQDKTQLLAKLWTAKHQLDALDALWPMRFAEWGTP